MTIHVSAHAGFVPSSALCDDAALAPLVAYLTAFDAGACEREPKRLRLVVHSLTSALARSVWAHLDGLRRRGFLVTAIMVKFTGDRDETAALLHYLDAFGIDAAKSNLRVARFGRARLLGEQLQVGSRCLWVDGSPLPLEREENAPSDQFAAAAARVSFDMIWAISEVLSGKELDRTWASGQDHSRRRRNAPI